MNEEYCGIVLNAENPLSDQDIPDGGANAQGPPANITFHKQLNFPGDTSMLKQSQRGEN